MVDREVNTQSLDYLEWKESSFLRMVDFILFYSLG